MFIFAPVRELLVALGFLVVIQTEDAKAVLGHYSSHSLLRIENESKCASKEKPEVEEEHT